MGNILLKRYFRENKWARHATSEEELKKLDNEWTHPIRGTKIDEKTGLHLSAYRTADIRKRIGCALSHYKLWKMCVDWNKPILVLIYQYGFTILFKLEFIF